MYLPFSKRFWNAFFPYRLVGNSIFVPDSETAYTFVPVGTGLSKLISTAFLMISSTLNSTSLVGVSLVISNSIFEGVYNL